MCRAPIANPSASFMERTADIVVVVVRQRLTHAHEDDVGYALDATEVTLAGINFSAVFGKGDALHENDLGDDLASGELPTEALLARGAKGAAQRASGLGGDTDGLASLAVFIGHVTHQYGLDQFAIWQTEQGFVGRTIGRGQVIDLFNRIGGIAIRQLRAQSLG